MHTSLLIPYFSFPWTSPSHRFYVLINYQNQIAYGNYCIGINSAYDNPCATVAHTPSRVSSLALTHTYTYNNKILITYTHIPEAQTKSQQSSLKTTRNIRVRRMQSLSLGELPPRRAADHPSSTGSLRYGRAADCRLTKLWVITHGIIHDHQWYSTCTLKDMAA